MDQKEMFLSFFQKEGAATRKVIARVPQEKSDYRADPKARTARELAWLIVYEEIVLADGLEKASFEWVPKDAPPVMAEILAIYDQHHDALTTRMRALPASRWDESVPFIMDGKELMRTPGYEMAWGFLLDQIHHRGQLSTYLRPMGSTVPAIYGPSADESE
jgi:uncharacterized damage-inducible protein DinB